ncbi:MAG: type II toxin-antitoxin system HicB family antitoxin [Chloroflexi bacterium]|nr:type II toxin-antitoxin system HicB family antitoxin [Chloroflexota bacterium]
MTGNSSNKIKFQVGIVVEPDGSEYHAYCPALKGLHTCGITVEETLGNACDAATAYIESLIKHGDPIPIGVVFGVPDSH